MLVWSNTFFHRPPATLSFFTTCDLFSAYFIKKALPAAMNSVSIGKTRFASARERIKNRKKSFRNFFSSHFAPRLFNYSTENFVCTLLTLYLMAKLGCRNCLKRKNWSTMKHQRLHLFPFCGGGEKHDRSTQTTTKILPDKRVNFSVFINFYCSFLRLMVSVAATVFIAPKAASPSHCE